MQPFCITFYASSNRYMVCDLPVTFAHTDNKEICIILYNYWYTAVYLANPLKNGWALISLYCKLCRLKVPPYQDGVQRKAQQEKSPTLVGTHGERPYISFPDCGEKPYTSFPDCGEKPYTSFPD